MVVEVMVPLELTVLLQKVLQVLLTVSHNVLIRQQLNHGLVMANTGLSVADS